MTEHGKASIQMVAAGLIGFALVVGGGGALLVLPRSSPAPKAASVARASVAAGTALAVPAPAARPATAVAPAGGTAVAASSPAPILPESAREEAAAPVAAAPAAAAAAAPKLAVTRHLEVAHQASIPAAVPAAPVARLDAAPAKKPFVAPKLDLSKTQSAVASSVHYGVSSRAELMGRAAGHVYNFSGKGAKNAQSAQVAAGSMDQQLDAAQAQLDSSGMSEHDKAVVSETLKTAKKATAASPSN
ncbi:MAG: hypothetical protein HY079_02805 [Elusimicrobia bacterium]|nr:hypothetical protein [Elusimicrobiota bacterium]